MIGIAHGYGLGGSGSNLWTREAVAALCTNGETVHLMCQESKPDRFDFVSGYTTYDADGTPETRFERDVPGPGRCVVHRPMLDILPTYVRPGTPSDYIRSILDLDDGEVHDYVERNLRVLRHISREYGVPSWHVNHTVLLSESLRRLKEEDGVAFAVMPHGSALEYVVRHDERMQATARRVLEQADRVFSLNQEIRERLGRYFPELDLTPRTVTVRVGVDTERFRPIPRSDRPEAVRALARSLVDTPRGRSPRQRKLLEEAVSGADDHETFRRAVDPAADYLDGPDEDLEARLGEIRWEEERVVAFVGRLIPAKGVQALVAALPLILEQHPRTRLLIVGAGWLREYLEAFVLALGQGEGARARSILEWAAERDPEEARPSGTAFLDHLEQRGRLDTYFTAAQRHLKEDRVLFTGFLEHHLLAYVFPLADVAVFPSAVAEASPLVIPEAAACGCLPMGTYFAGMRHSLDGLAPHVPGHLRHLMRLRPEPEHTAVDIAANVRAALDEDADLHKALRTAAVDEFDWRRIASTMANELRAMTP